MKKRNKLAKEYMNLIVHPNIKKPVLLPYVYSSFHLFVIQCEERDKLMAYLKKNYIETIIHYPIPPYRQKCYQDIVLDNQNTLLSSKICKVC